MHLLPENVVIGTNDLVPGIADLPRQPGGKKYKADNVPKKSAISTFYLRWRH